MKTKNNYKLLLLLCGILFFCAVSWAQQNPLTQKKLSVWDKANILAWVINTHKYYAVKTFPVPGNKSNLLLSFTYPDSLLVLPAFRLQTVSNITSLTFHFALADSIVYYDTCAIGLKNFRDSFYSVNVGTLNQPLQKNNDTYEQRMRTLTQCTNYECYHEYENDDNERNERFEFVGDKEFLNNPYLLFKYADLFSFVYHTYVYPYRYIKVNTLTIWFFDKPGNYYGRVVYDAATLQRTFHGQ